MPKGGKCKMECKNRKKKKWVYKRNSQVSCFGVTIVGLPNFHSCGNMSSISKRPCLQNNIAKRSLNFKLKYIESLKLPAEKYLKLDILDQRVCGVRPECSVL